MSGWNWKRHGQLMASASVFVISMSATGNQAFAACAPDPVGAGGTVTCTGSDTNGFTSEQSGLTVNVQEGAVVDGAPAPPPAASILLEDDGTLTNAGTIIFNQAGGTAAGQALRVDDRYTVINNGLIQSNSTSTSTDPDTASIAVTGSTAPIIHNNKSIVVDTTVTGYGIYTGGNATVTNSGTIDVSGKSAVGIYTQLDSKSDNSGAITVKGMNAHFAAGMFQGSVTNSGTIDVEVVGMSKTPGSTVDPFAIAMYAGGGLSANNIGIIDVDVTANGMIGAGIAIGSNILAPGSIQNSGSITVDVEGIGSTGYGIRLSGNKSTATNAGSIDVSVIGTASGAGISAQEAYDDLKITNTKSGTISSNDVGIQAYNFGIEINNAGTIDAKGHGIVIADSVLSADALNTVTNSGLLISGKDAVGIGKGDLVLDNSGSIRGLIAVNAGDGKQTITNSGTLDGDVILRGGDDTIALFDGSLITGDIDGGTGVDTISSGGMNEIAGVVTGIEDVSILDGLLLLSLKSGSDIDKVNVNAGTAFWNGTGAAEVHVAAAATLAGLGEIKGNVENAGRLLPGYLGTDLKVTGNYTQTSTGVLGVALENGSNGRLTVSDSAALDGVLTTALVGSDLTALEGKSFTVLNAGSINGMLQTTGTVQEGFWTLNIQQTATAVTVTVTEVDLTIGASAPVTGTLAGAIAAAAPAESQGNGIVINGHSNTVDIIDTADHAATSLSYDSLGDWESTAASFAGNWNRLGDRTPATSMPKTGSAEFEGTTKGELTGTGSPEAFVVEGNVMLTADFAKGLVNADFTGMEKIDGEGVASAWIDFRARMSIADGTSEFAGTAGSDDGVWNGEARGGFFGDDDGMPGHAAGLWSISSPLGRALGGFTAKRQ